MQKKIIAVAVAGLSTAAFAQTNVTIYGVADVSGQGYSLSQSKAPSKVLGGNQGNVFSVQSNSSPRNVLARYALRTSGSTSRATKDR